MEAIKMLLKLFCLIILFSTQLISQSNNWPPKQWLDSVYSEHVRGGWIATRNLYGTAYLKNGDTLKDCYIRPWESSCDILESFKFNSVSIMNNDLNHVSAIANATKDSLELYNLKVGYLYRLDKSENHIVIYDAPDYSNLKYFGSSMLLINQRIDIKIKIYSALGSFVQGKHNTNKLILKFINHRYNQSLKERDFKTGMDMIDYILDAENKKQETEIGHS